MKNPLQAIIVTALAFAVIAGTAQAQNAPPPLNPGLAALTARVNAIAGDGPISEDVLREGKERSLLCSQCHGEDGNSTRPEIPILAGQNPVYLLDQIERFTVGKRKNFVMQKLAASLSDEEKVKLVLYFASMPKKHSSGDPELAAKGKIPFEKYCQRCHGADGHGTAGYARLAGQHPTYIIKTLTDFRDRKGDRNNPYMYSFTQLLSDADIEAVAAYIANLR